MGLKTLGKNRSKESDGGIQPVRVQAVILNDKDYPESFTKKDKWHSIGTIFYSELNSPSKGKINFENLNTARPLFPHQKNFPIENEMVFILSLPSLGASGQNITAKEKFYITPMNTWGSVNHNTIPDPIFKAVQALSSTMNQTYQQTETGTPNRTNASSGTEEISYGPTFKQKNNIKNLQPYQGDIFYEGRWGHSLRFGSTVKEGQPKNNWSDEGNDGDPIILIRNGQYDDGKDSWIPQNENINDDPSSIYLTSTQKIKIETANNKFTSYNTAPDKPNEYKDSQVIVSSNRLVFNAKTDSVLISGEKSIFLGSNSSLNLNAGKNVVVECDDIKLGNKDATEPIILGDKFLNDLNDVLSSIQQFMTQVGGLPIMIAPFTPSAAHQSSALKLAQQTGKMISKIETYKSKISKTQ